MHEHRHAFDFSDEERIVSDLPERDWADSLGEAPRAYGSQPIPLVEDLSMQVQVGSLVWHRKAVGGQMTACGQTIDYQRAVVGQRFENYAGELCAAGCFSGWELAQSVVENERLHEESDREQKLNEERWRNFFDQQRADRKPKKEKP